MSDISFLTPYWSGREMMRIHLASLRRFHPGAPILVSKRGGDEDEMAGWRREFGIDYQLEECGYTDAYLRLLQRCRPSTPHPRPRHVSLVGLDSLLRVCGSAATTSSDEERIRLPEDAGSDPGLNRWLAALAPGRTASNLLIFDRRLESRGAARIPGTRPLARGT